MNQVLVSVIITTKNEEKNIANLLSSLQQQTFNNFETIVVDNFSSDRTPEICIEYGVKFFQAGPERSAQRNYGVSKSVGKYILVLDADMVLTSGVIEACVSEIENNSHIKSIVIPEKSIGENFWSKCKAFERNFYFLDTSENSIEAPRFFPKNIFLKVGGYDEKINAFEDWDLSERIKQLHTESSRIKCHIIHNEGKISLIKLLKKKFYYGQYGSYYLKKSRSQKFSPKTIYFLRPVFYRYWREWFRNPLVSLGTIYMLSMELIVGGLGFIYGKFKRAN